MGSTELSGAAIEDGTAIRGGTEAELPGMPGSAASGRYVCGHGRAGGRLRQDGGRECRSPAVLLRADLQPALVISVRR